MIEVRSYRRVFDLERRIYSVERLRLNPGGVPVRGVVYFVALVLLALLAGAVPPLSTLLRAVPWLARDVLGPAVGAMVVGVLRVDGRTFHVAAAALAGHLCAPRRLDGLGRRSQAWGAWSPQELLVLPDGSDGRLRALSYEGPGAVLVAVEHALSGPPSGWSPGRARRLLLRGRGAGRPLQRGRVIVLERRTRLRVMARHTRRV